MPSNHAAWIVEPKTKMQVKEAPYSPPGPGEVVIHTHAVAINPLDYKIEDMGFIQNMNIAYPTIMGSDVSGTIEEVGEGVEGLPAGQKVAAYVYSPPQSVASARRC